MARINEAAKVAGIVTAKERRNLYSWLFIIVE
jgi:hypothetical protein